LRQNAHAPMKFQSVAVPARTRFNGPCASATLIWISRLASITTMNTPHYGTPLATFFATVSGQRLLYAMSAVTVMAIVVAPTMADFKSVDDDVRSQFKRNCRFIPTPQFFPCPTGTPRRLKSYWPFATAAWG